MCGPKIAEEFPVVTLDSNALDAVRMLATHRLPGLVVTDTAGIPVTILPASQVVRLLVPHTSRRIRRSQECMSESMGRPRRGQTRRQDGREMLPKQLPDMATVKADDTIVEVAAIMARRRARWSP